MSGCIGALPTPAGIAMAVNKGAALCLDPKGIALWQRSKGVALQLGPKAGLWLCRGQTLLGLALHRATLAKGTGQVGRDTTKGRPQGAGLRRLKASLAWCLHEQAKRA